MIEIKCDHCDTNFAHQNYHYCKFCFDEKMIEITKLKSDNKLLLKALEELDERMVHPLYCGDNVNLQDIIWQTLDDMGCPKQNNTPDVCSDCGGKGKWKYPRSTVKEGFVWVTCVKCKKYNKKG